MASFDQITENWPSTTDRGKESDNMATLEKMMADQGGFGKYQWLVYINSIFSINSSNWLSMQLCYLLLYPAFTCQQQNNQGIWIDIDTNSQEHKNKCVPNHFCGNPDIQWQRDESSPLSLNNWIL